MKRLGFGLLIVFLLFVPAANAIAQAQRGMPATKKWEYRVVAACDWPRDKMLDQLGQEGWELVAVASYGNEGGCQNYTFKRPRPKNAPVFAPAKPNPTPTPAPACTLTLEQSPTVHALRLGLSAAELAVALPEIKLMIENTLSHPPMRRSQAMQNLYFQVFGLSPDSTDYVKALARQFAPATSVSIDFYEKKIARISLQFDNQSDLLQWNEQTWIQKLAESFGLPNFESWQRPKGGGPLTLTCTGFEATASLQSFTLTDTAAFAKAKQWLADEDVRLRREFKP